MKTRLTRGRLNWIIAALLCLAWTYVLFPGDSVYAANNCKTCTKVWDCQTDCLCDNAQFNQSSGIGLVRVCMRICQQKIQNVEKHQCESTANPEDNCP